MEPCGGAKEQVVFSNCEWTLLSSRCAASQMRFKQRGLIAFSPRRPAVSFVQPPPGGPVTHGKRHFWHSKSQNHSTEYSVKSSGCTVSFSVCHARTRSAAVPQSADLTTDVIVPIYIKCRCLCMHETLTRTPVEGAHCVKSLISSRRRN